ncbi:hypothetical protein PAESOLCIP111_02558 [Paenibacillus solanacearum]|uniref:Uncharacterized protein n=1 Tax=Paenibacillus solanacearum TaxID=2048548 RepID=A0A916K0Y8_9BACL|nr:DUF4855 domain-containing protein [Paenibacillus solanacearum]CAG7623753.1 hypothetical protein PAESOLCIP111_02558 [Paenibacillus solanacearum]
MIPASSSGFLSPTAYQLRNHVCVLPCGSLLDDTPLKWTDAQLQYYAKYILNGQPIDSMFKGFIFNAVRTRDSHFIYPLYVGFGEPSERIDWQQWIDALFAPDANFQALHRVTGTEKVDIWVSIPYPHPYQRSFGVVQGRNLDFEVATDRFAAVIWWIDQFMNRWNSRKDLHDRLEFRGFLWQRETIDASDENLVKWVNGAISARKLLSMWLANYGSGGIIKWSELGFHLTLLNTNYTGNTSYDTSWIRNACLFSRHYHTGIQITWGKGLIYNATHQLDYFNLGLASMSRYMNESFLVYPFPNQTLDTLYREKLIDYIRLYTFVKGLYVKTNYPGIAY